MSLPARDNYLNREYPKGKIKIQDSMDNKRSKRPTQASCNLNIFVRMMCSLHVPPYNMNSRKLKTHINCVIKNDNSANYLQDRTGWENLNIQSHGISTTSLQISRNLKLPPKSDEYCKCYIYTNFWKVGPFVFDEQPSGNYKIDQKGQIIMKRGRQQMTRNRCR